MTTNRLIAELAKAVRAAVEQQPPPTPLYCLALLYSPNGSPADAHVMLGDLAHRDRQLARARRDGDPPLLFAAADYTEEIHPAVIAGLLAPELVELGDKLAERWELSEDRESAGALLEQVARLLNDTPPAVSLADDFLALPVDADDQEVAGVFDRLASPQLADRYRSNGWHPADE
jgi:hypothetical protein